MLSKRTIFISLIMLLVLVGNVSGKVIYNFDETLPSNSITALASDNLGRMWIGTKNGLAVYDGQMRYYNTSNSTLNSDEIRSFYVKETEIEVGDAKGFVSLEGWQDIDWDSSTKVYLNSAVDAIIQDAKGGFWIGRSYGLIFYIDNSDRKIDVDSAVVYINFFSDTEAIQNGYDTPVNIRLTDNYIRDIALEEYINGDTVALWIATDNGLTRLVFDYAKPENSYCDTYISANSALPTNKLWSLYYDNGKLWIGTDGAGLVKYDIDADVWTQYNTSNSQIVSDIVNDIVEQDGIIWLATEGGISRYNIKKDEWKNYTILDGVAESILTSCAVDGYGNVWFGTNNSGITIVNRVWQEFSEETRDDIDGTESAFAVKASAGSIYASFFSPPGFEGLYYMDYYSGNFTKVIGADTAYRIVADDENGTVYIQAEDKVYAAVSGVIEDTYVFNQIKDIALADTVLFVLTSTGVFKADGSTVTASAFNKLQGFGNKLYLLTDTEVYTYSNGSIEKLGEVSENISSFLPVENLYVVFTTSGSAFFLGYDVNKKQLTTSSGTEIDVAKIDVPINKVFKLDDIVYVASDTKLFVLNSKGEKRMFVPFTKLDGLDVEHINSLAGDTSDILLGTSDQGFLLYKRSVFAPKVYITEYPGDLVKKNSVDISFDAYDERKGVVFSYKLDGPVSFDWCAFNEQKTATFSGLLAGNYSFTVMALDKDGNIDSATVSFVVYSNEGQVLAGETEVFLYIPDNALGGVSLSIEKLSQQQLTSKARSSDIILLYDVLPHSVVFSKYVVLGFNVSDISSDSYSNLGIYYWNNFEGTWEHIGGSIESNWIKSAIKRSGIYSVQYKAVSGEKELNIEVLSVKPRVITREKKIYIIFYITKAANVTVDMYNSSGTLIKRIENDKAFGAGKNIIETEIADLYTGLYFISLIANDNGTKTKKMTGFYVK